MSAAVHNAATIIAALARLHDVRALSLAAVQTVMAVRLSAVAAAAGLDPVPELARRHRAFEVAFALQDLSHAIARAWPEPFGVNRPCCMRLSPDEVTLAAMVRAAAAADNAAFGRAVDGFVRTDRHPALWDACVRAVALLG